MTRVRTIIIAAVLAVVLAVGAGAYWYLKDDAPDAVALNTAVKSVQDSDSALVDGIEGTWAVDTQTGNYDFDSATGTFAGFRIKEELASIGSTTAVGRTGAVSGTVVIDGTTVTAAQFEVDLRTVTTNESRRDDRVQSALATSRFPTATFKLTQPIALGDGADEGDKVSVTAVGDLTIKGVTKPVSMKLDAQLVEDTIVIVGSTNVAFSDYGVQVPSAQIVLSVEDHGVVEMQLLLKKE